MQADNSESIFEHTGRLFYKVAQINTIMILNICEQHYHTPSPSSSAILIVCHYSSGQIIVPTGGIKTLCTMIVDTQLRHETYQQPYFGVVAMFCWQTTTYQPKNGGYSIQHHNDVHSGETHLTETKAR